MFRPVLLCFAAILLAADGADGECSLPPGWIGTWTAYGVIKPLSITADGFDNNVTCIQSSGDLALVQVPQTETCYRCVKFYQRHENVMEFAMSGCRSEAGPIETVCSNFDVVRMQLVMRVEAEPVTCPIQEQHSIKSYSLGEEGDSCSDSDSAVVPFSDGKKLRFTFNACPDIDEFEDVTEDVECVGTWTATSFVGSYFVGKLVDVDRRTRYRCYTLSEEEVEGEMVPVLRSAHSDAVCAESDGPMFPRTLRRMVLTQED